MKATLLIPVIATTLAACCAQHHTTESAQSQASWAAFCETRGYDFNNNTDSILNEYLDTWRGSADEEAALTQAGLEIY